MKTKQLPKVDHTPAELDAASRLLLSAAAVLEKYGHTKDTLGDCERGFCVLGAMNHANDYAGKSDLFIEARRRLRDAIGDPKRIADWNNAAERTPDEVIAKLRAAAFAL